MVAQPHQDSTNFYRMLQSSRMNEYFFEKANVLKIEHSKVVHFNRTEPKQRKLHRINLMNIRPRL